MNWGPPPDWKPPDEWLPPERGRNLTPYALGAIGVLLAGTIVGVVSIALAVLLTVAIVAGMSVTREREKRERYEEQLRQWYARNPDPQHRAQTPPPVRAPKSQWTSAGAALAVIAAVGGLAILGSVVVLFVLLSSGNFKLGNK